LFVFSGTSSVFPQENDDDEADYWQSIDFGSDDFEEVKRLIKLYHIDRSYYNKKKAWIYASNFALGKMKKPREMLPELFYKAKIKDKEEKQHLTGKIYKLSPSDNFVIHIKPENSGNFPPDKKKWKKRLQELDDAWNQIPFTSDDFDRILKHILSEEQGNSSPNKFYIAAAQGYLNSLDPHSTIVSKKAWEETTKNTEDSSFEGIGAVLSKFGDYTIVETPMEGQPAQRAGIKPGDIIISVDGKSIKRMDLSRVIKKIKGPNGTPVTLTIRRFGEPQDINITIIRQKIEVKNVQGRLIDNHKDIGYIKLSGFIDNSLENIKKMYEKLNNQAEGKKLRGLIFDLRFNSGGLLQEAIDIADYFLEEGNIVSVKSPGVKDEEYAASSGSIDIPLVVLVNSQSASASEIVASALQDNGKGIILGERTFGKASVQTLVNPLIRNDYYVKLTIARYFSPSGRTLQETGVYPDIDIIEEPGKKKEDTIREEDLANHLSKIDSKYESPNKPQINELLLCEKRMGIADRIFISSRDGAVKPDYQMLKAADFLECLIDIKSRKSISDL
jgi:C-terminal peptidase prc